MATTKAVLALDVGNARIGLALASLEARLPSPYKTLENTEDVFAKLQEVIAAEHVVAVVVGLPRGLDGQTTAQTHAIEAFVHELKATIDLPISWQDEAVTSRKAKAELEARGKPYTRGDVDALAATYILEDWLQNNQERTQ